MSHWCPGLGARVGEPTYCTAFFFHINGSWYLGLTCRAAVKLDRESVHSSHTQRTPCSPAVSHSFTRCLSCRTALFRKANSDPCCMKENWPISGYTLQSMTTESDWLKITIGEYLLLNPHLLHRITDCISFQSLLCTYRNYNLASWVYS